MYRPSVIESPSGEVPAKVPRWDLEEQRLAATEKVFLVAPCWFSDFREFMELEVGQTELTWAHKPPGRDHPLGAPWWLVPHVSAFWLSPEASRVSFVQKKIIKKFQGI
jgi:hypothetical protein